MKKLKKNKPYGKYNTYYLLLSYIFFSISTLTFSQADKPQSESPKTTSQSEEVKPNFGRTLDNIEFELSNKYQYVVDVKLKVLQKKKSKGFYNSQNLELYKFFFDSVPEAKVSWEKKEGTDNTYKTVIPPLKPNRFYLLETYYYSSGGMIALFLMMHDQKNTNWYTDKKEWMNLLTKISDTNTTIYNGQKRPLPITYDPTKEELISFKKSIDSIKLTQYDITELQYIGDTTDKEEIKKKKIELKKIKEDIISKLDKEAKKAFKLLNFSENQDKYCNDSLVEFSKWVQGNTTCFSGEDDDIKFSSIMGDFLDYINIYNFYKKYLSRPFDDQSIEKGTLKSFIEKSIKTERELFNDSDFFIPSYLHPFEEIIEKKTKPIPSTYPKTFKTAYKLSLVPDFGYIGYLSDSENTPKGGNLFLGVNVSLSPSNKDVPLRISRLSLWQRLSIHTGVTVGSIAETNVRDNFFGNYSLLLGGSYKVITQGTRINFGGLLYNKIDAINGSKSIAVQPYIGLSIDLEIKKWLKTVFPNLKIQP
ncbi:hypothetical protein [Flavivirga rizhaonensis]|uniref:Uncharacterized protein n=1 Tax=Flavivirga rizhaonensis TaxID=2559571 RepID=A0A4S1DZE0_9FLAO|nr:hypothetical protein [Flavivirga rizhaonensis]TGV03383.1 hypothetical protein EM932_06840 [Flavivirga rizhaonensis]